MMVKQVGISFPLTLKKKEKKKSPRRQCRSGAGAPSVIWLHGSQLLASFLRLVML